MSCMGHKINFHARQLGIDSHKCAQWCNWCIRFLPQSAWRLYLHSKQHSIGTVDDKVSCDPEVGFSHVSLSYCHQYTELLNSSHPGQNVNHFADHISKCIFLNDMTCFSIGNFTEVCSYRSSWQYVSIRSGNGLVPNRRQAITWTNNDLVRRHIYAALGGDKLNENFETNNIRHNTQFEISHTANRKSTN